MDQMMGSYTLDPIYEAAVECDLPVAVHQSGSEGCYYASQTVAGGVPRSYGERHVVLTQVGAKRGRRHRERDAREVPRAEVRDDRVGMR